MLVNLSYSFMHPQKVVQKGVDRRVENPQKRVVNYSNGAERDKQIPLAHAQTNSLSVLLLKLPIYENISHAKCMVAGQQL